ncbi:MULTISPECIES: hypothetical protein [unclassified Rathayibacter]|uniref:hypothetical protein n=1 Tax=unclassified Rathayibacter TaxID=2609250 RepID=UPI000CE79B4C|nr:MULTISPECIES: hypothetical protein [unclassified Rathayibacter]PPF14679.1 hypothetical protein C5B92_14675 [Rathayibacter sp. AY1A4]PPF52933.1 hypothetical protein C5C55_14830 [Rathayibacter sp. AY1C2]PPG55666.1 hypothetical protein C5C57_16795 [Rathayibacter sp. AY1C5]PPG57148.1 hypothetical protein C5C69_14995 [Rathayibacter sp. AY1C7]PPH34730.1 hypothetical protein C5C53_14855 [Rathayibacter sp. AY1E3]
MHLLELTIGPRHFSLPVDVDRVGLTQRLEQAAAAGGAFVEIPTSRGTTSAFVTPATAVFLDVIDAPDETADGLDPRTSSIDVDLVDRFSKW